MTASVSLRNVSGEALSLGRPGQPDSRRVDKDEVIHVDGVLAKAKDQPEDAIVIVDGDDARAWPTATWAIAKTPATSKEN